MAYVSSSAHIRVLIFVALSFFFSTAPAQQSSNPSLANFSIITSSFESILGPSPFIQLLANASEPLFHEAAVYYPESDSLFVVSNRIKLNVSDPSTSNQTILLSEVTNVSSTDTSSITVSTVPDTAIALPNGGVNYLGTSPQAILIAAQGSKNRTSGIYSLPDPVNDPANQVPVVTSFYGTEFNSPNDVVVNPEDGSIWFTDPTYGYLQGLRPAPKLPHQVYRYDPATNSTRVVADGFVQPNGLTFSPDYTILYITDTGAQEAASTPDLEGPRTIYAFDVEYPGPFLGNRRVFAMADIGLPDGIKCDTDGNVYSGIGDGVAVWNDKGLLLGKILVDGGAANLGFGKDGELFIMNEKRLWRAQLSTSVRGAILGI